MRRRFGPFAGVPTRKLCDECAARSPHITCELCGASPFTRAEQRMILRRGYASVLFQGVKTCSVFIYELGRSDGAPIAGVRGTSRHEALLAALAAADAATRCPCGGIADLYGYCVRCNMRPRELALDVLGSRIGAP